MARRPHLGIELLRGVQRLGERALDRRSFRGRDVGEQLVDRIRANLDQQDHRELADVVVVRSRADAERVGAVPYAVAVAEAFASGMSLTRSS